MTGDGKSGSEEQKWRWVVELGHENAPDGAVHFSEFTVLLSANSAAVPSEIQGAIGFI